MHIRIPTEQQVKSVSVNGITVKKNTGWSVEGAVLDIPLLTNTGPLISAFNTEPMTLNQYEMKRALRLPALILLFAHPVMSVSAQEKPLWENSAFQLYPDRVVQQGLPAKPYQTDHWHPITKARRTCFKALR